jgi:predicted flavoprotein YhiN
VAGPAATSRTPVVTETDFNGGRPAIIRRILRALPVTETVDFFRKIGVPLHEEPGGKLFPDSERSRDVLEALCARPRAPAPTSSGSIECRMSHVTTARSGWPRRRVS